MQLKKESFVAIASLLICLEAFAGDVPKVVKLQVEKELITYKDEASFEEAGRLPIGKISLPIPIVTSTDERLKVSIDGQNVWLDRTDAVYEGLPLTVDGDCAPRRLTSDSSATTRGLGEPCKSTPPISTKQTPASSAKQATTKKTTKESNKK